MKKIITLALVLIFVSALFAGCGSNESSQEITEQDDATFEYDTTEEVTEASEVVYLEDSGLLKIDTSIMDSTYEETKDILGIDLDPLQSFDWWGTDLESVDCKYNGLNLTLLFQKDALVMIMYDSGVEGAWDEDVYQAAQEEYTEVEKHFFKVDSNAAFNVLSESLAATGQTVFRQRYISVNMY